MMINQQQQARNILGFRQQSGEFFDDIVGTEVCARPKGMTCYYIGGIRKPKP